MASDDIAHLGIDVSTKGLAKGEKALNKYAATGEKTERRTKSSTSSMGMSYRTLAVAVTSVVAAASSLSKVVSITREFDVLNSQLITATGSAKGAATAFSAIQDFAATTPYDLAQATKAFTQLVNLGLTPSEAAMTSYGNTASAMGKDLSQMVEAVADATVGEFERLKEFGIKSSTQGDQISFTFQGVTKTVKKEASAIEGYLTNIGQNQFAGAMATRAATADGAISNLGDTWDSLFLTISQNNVGDLIKESAVTAASYLQQLNDAIASGALQNSFDAVLIKFEGFVKDTRSLLEIMSETFDEESRNSADTFGNNMLKGLKVLPEMTRFFIQAAAVSLAKMVQYAELYGDEFVDIIALRFKMVMDMTKLDGQVIANAMNPFADHVDFISKREALSAEYAKLEEGIKQAASDRGNALDKISDDLINSYALESVAATDSYEARIKLSDSLLDSYNKEKAAKSSAGDALDQFKIKPSVIADIDTAADKIDSLNDQIASIGEDAANPFDQMVTGANQALTAMSGMFESGSKDAQKLAVAMSALNLISAVQAVLTQGEGDPYTAFGRMAAMAGMVASLGVEIGSLGGSFEDTAAQKQETQGVNEWGEKSESIANSVDITASATDKLVGINTNMLSALVTMQQGISAAAETSLKGIGDVNFGTSGEDSVVGNVYSEYSNDLNLNDKADQVYGGIMGEKVGAIIGSAFTTIPMAIGKLLGGSSKVTDSGIKILGGTMADILDGAVVSAYSITSAKKHAWSHTKDYYNESALEGASDQFSLVFSSLAESVYQGGIALGMSGSSLEDSINKFVLETTEISLKGLSSDEQAAEIEAVFSKLFDDLTESVIPFVDDFQQMGEGLGETLARIATEVAVADYAIKNLGINLGDKLANPQLFTQIADNLTTLTGGIEGFSSKVSSFVEDFAPDTVKFTMYSDALTESLAAVGLSVPDSTDNFYKLMTTLDGTTAAGQAQIATLLNVQDTANEYYDLLDDRQSASKNLLASKSALELELLGLQGKSTEVLAITRANELAATDSSLVSLQKLIYAEEDRNTAKSKETAALEASKSKMESYIETLKGLSGSIASAVAGIYGVSDAVSAMSLDSALAAARVGDFSDALKLDLSAYNLDEADFSSAVAFNSAQASAANKLLEIAQLSDSVTGASSLDDLMLAANQSQVEILTSINDTLAGSYVPTTTTTSSNDDLVVELQSIKAELAEIKTATKTSAKKSTDIADDTMFIRRGDGINVVVA